MSNTIHPGLEGILVAETRLSDVDGELGRLIIAGRDVESLRCPFEDVVFLLGLGGTEVPGHVPTTVERAAVREALGVGRVRAFERLPRLALERADAMGAVRAALAHLTTEDPIEAIGAVAAFAAAWSRVARGKAPIPPDPRLAHAADLLRMITGGPADAARVAALDAYLVTVSDHGMNASTFAARVITSTGAGLVAALVGALGALEGPLHGGAPGPVLDMLDAIGTPEHAVPWLESELAAGRRIMGMGHRIYRVRDPRAAVLERATLELEAAGVSTGRLALARAVERAAFGVLRERHPLRPLHANVEFYTAVLLDTLGVPRELFTAVFAAARTAGWCAHVAEHRATGRLIRPASRYIGLVP